ncbi:MAG: 30S ribosomal protein S20 [Microgenomates group bacterium GW2011_GWA1_48_10]|uniref:Small ribosomal subunit protein bS20 n=1 Tax=Candidatus Gottesmanbacteria bacterium RIFCSPHIGHO2_01_FULL_47_48 TaxID=1798381 RepID=A0A1F5ZZN6_9BACT|nr:MAG: 30S ribosomal protein S20 [Microgenomates group bacterium GW2011_GWA1_48_10]OGG17814.1 MAG: hypothetical protein A2721_02215 [Candidatus Gottesmanbacteria bacterium RIFCSPHIGHO2_01_FULL_47_48]
MPVIKSAIKKLRQSLARTERNRSVKRQIKEKIAQFKVKPTVKTFASLSSSLDKAAKSNLFHPNKSARLKSRLSKFLVANNK